MSFQPVKPRSADRLAEFRQNIFSDELYIYIYIYIYIVIMITQSKESSMHECRAKYIQDKTDNNVKKYNSSFTLEGDLQIYIYIYII